MGHKIVQNQEYTSTNTRRPFSFKAMIIWAKLKIDGYTEKEINYEGLYGIRLF